MHLAYLPDPLKGVRLRLSIYGGVLEHQEARIEAEMAKLRPILGDALYSEQDDTLQECIGRMLLKYGKTVSAAESCTGGTISALFTSIPGSSEYYLGSVTSYANSVKTGVLGVDPKVIEEHGAVSSECVAQMADGVRRLTGSDFSVATSGIAGPGGGSDSKPVGLVWIGVSSQKGTETLKMVFKGDRKRNMERFAASALDTLRKKLINELTD
jgi:nicotinamide-nucleotide amidase